MPFPDGENVFSNQIKEDLISRIAISPNPTNGKFNIKLNDVTAEKVVVYNMLGKVVSETSVTENAKSLDIDLSELPASLYLVHVHAVDEVILKKVIKE
jgi:calcineurin-like phosphoesterase